jgi:hypothetical protein
MILKLNSSTLIGKGLRRECHFHPEDENRCIKIVVAGDHKETLREQSYYNLLSNRNISWSMLAKFYGNVETNRGEGAVFELIRDYQGDVSKTLEYYLSAQDEPDFNYQNLSKLLTLLKQYLMKWKIVTMAIKPQNIVYKKINKTEGTLIIIDNIGNSDFIPICNYVDNFAIRKIRRKWQRFEFSLTKNYNHNKALQRMLKDSNR